MIETIFLDRDGIINVDTGYIANVTQVQFIDENLQLLSGLNAEKVVIITNQSGIERGIINPVEYNIIASMVEEHLRGLGFNILGTFTCPHQPYQNNIANCACRKPSPFLINLAVKQFGLRKEKAIMIGDKESDYWAGVNASLSKSFLLKSQYVNGTKIRAYSTMREIVDDVRRIYN